jgi:UDP-N-acetylmuramate dehydrogenase
MMGINSLIHENIPLAPFSTLNLGGKAQFFAQPTNLKELLYLLNFARDKNLNVFILGAGSNLLIRNEPIRGLVIHTEKLKKCEFNGNKIFVECGYSLKKLIGEAMHRNLSGLENLVAIPASIGGAVSMNAGGKFGEIGTFVEKCWAINLSDFEVYEIEKKNLKFGYRNSNLQQYFIYKVELSLTPSTQEEIKINLMKALKHKLATQPLTSYNAGCVFKNPSGASAAALIQKCGLKDYSIGKVKISAKHANFFINTGDSSDDFLALIEFVQKKVFETFNIHLEREIRIWPDEPNYRFR